MMASFDLDELWQRGYVAVHAVNALDHYQHSPVVPTHPRKQGIKGSDVVVSEWLPRGPRKLAALQDTVVSQGIVDDQIFPAEEVADEPHVGAMAADQGHRGFRAQQFR